MLNERKINLPLSVVVNERRLWQMVSSLLQQRFGRIRLQNSLSSRNSDEAIKCMTLFHGEKCSAFTLDITDVYYSLPQTELLNILKLLLEMNLVGLQVRSGISVGNSLVLVDIYLHSAVVYANGALHAHAFGDALLVRFCQTFSWIPWMLP